MGQTQEQAKMEHTPEPWIADGGVDIEGDGYTILRLVLPPPHKSGFTTGAAYGMSKANADRIAACVNVMGGYSLLDGKWVKTHERIPNPSEYRDRAEAAEKERTEHFDDLNAALNRAGVCLCDIDTYGGEIDKLTTERDTAIKERDGLSGELKKLIEFVLTARGTNTPEWMTSLCRKLDHAAAQIGEPIQSRHDRRDDIIRFAALSQSQQGSEKEPKWVGDLRASVEQIEKPSPLDEAVELLTLALAYIDDAVLLGGFKADVPEAHAREVRAFLTKHKKS